MADTRTNRRAVREFSGSALASALILAVVVAYGLHVVLVAGPAMQAAEQQLERAIASEDRGFCEMFDMGPGTTKFAACSQALALIRKQQTDRDNAAAQGIL